MLDECSDTTARRSPDPYPEKGRGKDRHRLSDPLSGRGYAPSYDRARQPILPAIIVVAKPATVIVAAQTAEPSNREARPRTSLAHLADVEICSFLLHGRTQRTCRRSGPARSPTTRPSVSSIVRSKRSSDRGSCVTTTIPAPLVSAI